ncbi:AAA family ATPase [Rhizobium sp. G21]|uniref:AAA family ATPase n=1 Tax=Rhizobium sp. G21 TaxID=2758439 RepID=UPI001603D5C6|nr:AAA family ATPase [Rhizobium sp. G21]MBB1250045.1 AAA family ATPase [Rhizobium sp. G21]
MKIEAVAARNFRSLKRAGLEKCSDVNVLIGKNNAGKSTILAAIEFAFDFMGTDSITGPWTPRGRPIDEITGRNQQGLVQIGIQFRISSEQSTFIRNAVASDLEGIEVALKALENREQLSVIVAGRLHDGILTKYIQEISVGKIIDSGEFITTDGNKLLFIPDDAALELLVSERRIAQLKVNIEDLAKIGPEIARSPAFRQRERSERPERSEMRFYTRNLNLPQEINRKLEAIFEAANSQDEISSSIEALREEFRDNISQIQSTPLKEAIQSFTGAVRKPPAYIKPIIRMIANNSVLHFKETRQAIGAREAEQLLKLKTKRGGPERLASLQSTVKSLLGVAVDAFDSDDGLLQSIRGGRAAEIDIDEFLVEANGAGIREALRIILDLELERPAYALIEEPEVHLHPGLEKVLHSYLVEKGNFCQVFIATHSTNFIDVSNKQNIYLVSRDKYKNSFIDITINEDDILKIPGEMGIKPSSVLMFDRLLFVEGPSDESIISNLAKSLGLDFSAVGLGLVQMGGASNNQHFASEATLDLLSRRQIPMTFLLDRDEREEDEIKKAEKRLGQRATMHWLKKRELENYLLVPAAIQKLIEFKLSTSSNKNQLVTTSDIAIAINEEAEALKDNVLSMTLAKKLMRPVYIDRLEEMM